eukprot:COSAG02_NODE_113_length_35905_cov_25.229012_9_plen_72_part_00
MLDHVSELVARVWRDELLAANQQINAGLKFMPYVERIIDEKQKQSADFCIPCNVNFELGLPVPVYIDGDRN